MSLIISSAAPALLEACEKYRANVAENFKELSAGYQWDTVRMGDGTMLASEDAPMTRAKEVELQKDVFGKVNFFSHMDRDEEMLQAFSQIVIKRVYDKIALDNPIPLFYDMYTQADLDSKLEIHDAYGGRVLPWSYGAKRIASAFVEKEWTVLLNPWQLKYRLTAHQIQTGRVLISEIVREAARNILAHKVKIAMDAMAAAYTTSGSYTINGGAADISITNLKAALRGVRGLTEVRAVVGCHTALQPVYFLSGYDVPASGNGTGFAEDVKLEVHKTGKIGMFAGAPVVPLKTYTDPLYATTVYTAADVYVVPVDEKKNFNIFAEYGSTAAEPIIRDADSKTLFINFYWEDKAYVNTDKIKYGRRIRNNATS